MRRYYKVKKLLIFLLILFSSCERKLCPTYSSVEKNDFQTENIVDALRKKNLPVEVHTFDQEGHGFRDGIVKRKVLEATEAFFRKHLHL